MMGFAPLDRSYDRFSLDLQARRPWRRRRRGGGRAPREPLRLVPCVRRGEGRGPDEFAANASAGGARVRHGQHLGRASLRTRPPWPFPAPTAAPALRPPWVPTARAMI